jgi:hypothetical protein
MLTTATGKAAKSKSRIYNGRIVDGNLPWQAVTEIYNRNEGERLSIDQTKRIARGALDKILQQLIASRN